MNFSRQPFWSNAGLWGKIGVLMPDTQTAKLDERTLVESSVKGDEGAMQVLYRRHSGKIYGLALRMTGSPADAEDIVQDTFMRAFQHLGKFRRDSSFSTWLYRIAVNRTRDWAKKRKPTSPEVEIAQAPRQADAMVGKRLEKALGRLPFGYREVLVLHDVLGMRHAEIGPALGIKAGTSKSQLHKARASMRQMLTNAQGAS